MTPRLVQVRNQNLNFFTRAWVVRALMIFRLAKDSDRLPLSMTNFLGECSIPDYVIEKERRHLFKVVNDLTEVMEQRQTEIRELQPERPQRKSKESSKDTKRTKRKSKTSGSSKHDKTKGSSGNQPKLKSRHKSTKHKSKHRKT